MARVSESTVCNVQLIVDGLIDRKLTRNVQSAIIYNCGWNYRSKIDKEYQWRKFTYSDVCVCDVGGGDAWSDFGERRVMLAI